MNGDNSDAKRVAKASLFVSLGTLCVALASCWVSLAKSDEANRIAREALKTSQEANRIAREALETTQDQASRENTPAIEMAYYIAKSPDFLAEYDSRFIGQLQLVPRPIRTRFWRTEWSQYKGEAEKLYLFIIVVNRGPGRAERINIISYTWVPKINERRPDGLMDMEAPLGVLDRGQFYALLVDVLRTPDPAKPLDSRHFIEMTLKVEYRDALGRQYKPPERGIGKGITVGPLYDVPPP